MGDQKYDESMYFGTAALDLDEVADLSEALGYEEMLLTRSSRGVVVGLTRRGARTRCACPEACDCEAPDASPALVSNSCPEHNERPQVAPGCRAERHRNGAVRR